ncbi:MAG: carbon storage regulator [Planctomycetota bacterium]
MLVLSRKEGEKLFIGDDIVLTVNRISGNRVAIGIEAPRDVSIVRGELDRREEKKSNKVVGAAGGTSIPMTQTNLTIASRQS